MELIYVPVIKVYEHLTVSTSDTNCMGISFWLLPWCCYGPRGGFFHWYIKRGTKHTRVTLTSVWDRAGRYWTVLNLSVEEYGIPWGNTKRCWFDLIAVQKGDVSIYSVRKSRGAVFDLFEAPVVHDCCLLAISTTDTYRMFIASLICVDSADFPWSCRIKGKICWRTESIRPTQTRVWVCALYDWAIWGFSILKNGIKIINWL